MSEPQRSAFHPHNIPPTMSENRKKNYLVDGSHGLNNLAYLTDLMKNGRFDV
jgi:hypothetical protein